jgi:hypothetical protein
VFGALLATAHRKGLIAVNRMLLTDLNEEKKTVRIERALEQTKKFGIHFKPPKTKRGYRTIDLDDGIFALLRRKKLTTGFLGN